jgi:phage recombination protein Bet
MSTDLVKQETGALVIKHQLDFNDDTVKIIRELIAPKATENELKLFLYQCKRTGLDPMTRQIYCIHRRQKKQGTQDQYEERMTIQTSIDGFRVIAERSGSYAGQDEPVFMYDEKKRLLGAKVTVFKFAPDGQRYPAAVGVAYWSEYYGGGSMWDKMPHTMISKVAEALALRKAFPQDLSGLYTAEEMSLADAQANEAENSTWSYSLKQQAYLGKLLTTSSFEPASKAYAALERDINDFDNMTYKRYNELKAGLEQNQQNAAEAGNASYKQIQEEWKKKMTEDDFTTFEEVKKEEENKKVA